MTEATASQPSRFGLPTRVVRLPDPGPDGAPLFVRIRYLHPAHMTAAMGRLQEQAPKRLDGSRLTLSEQEAVYRQMDDAMRPIIAELVAEPRIAFPGGAQAPEGAVPWECFTFDNRQAIAAEGLLFSTGADRLTRLEAEEVAAAAVAAFPREAEGQATGSGGAVAGEAAPGAAA